MAKTKKAKKDIDSEEEDSLVEEEKEVIDQEDNFEPPKMQLKFGKYLQSDLDQISTDIIQLIKKNNLGNQLKLCESYTFEGEMTHDSNFFTFKDRVEYTFIKKSREVFSQEATRAFSSDLEKYWSNCEFSKLYKNYGVTEGFVVGEVFDSPELNFNTRDETEKTIEIAKDCKNYAILIAYFTQDTILEVLPKLNEITKWQKEKKVKLKIYAICPEEYLESDLYHSLLKETKSEKFETYSLDEEDSLYSVLTSSTNSTILIDKSREIQFLGPIQELAVEIIDLIVNNPKDKHNKNWVKDIEKIADKIMESEIPIKIGCKLGIKRIVTYDENLKKSTYCSFPLVQPLTQKKNTEIQEMLIKEITESLNKFHVSCSYRLSTDDLNSILVSNYGKVEKILGSKFGCVLINNKVIKYFPEDQFRPQKKINSESYFPVGNNDQLVAFSDNSVINTLIQPIPSQFQTHSLPSMNLQIPKKIIFNTFKNEEKEIELLAGNIVMIMILPENISAHFNSVVTQKLTEIEKFVKSQKGLKIQVIVTLEKLFNPKKLINKKIPYVKEKDLYIMKYPNEFYLGQMNSSDFLIVLLSKGKKVKYVGNLTDIDVQKTIQNISLENDPQYNSIDDIKLDDSRDYRETLGKFVEEIKKNESKRNYSPLVIFSYNKKLLIKNKKSINTSYGCFYVNIIIKDNDKSVEELKKYKNIANNPDFMVVIQKVKTEKLIFPKIFTCKLCSKTKLQGAFFYNQKEKLVICTECETKINSDFDSSKHQELLLMKASISEQKNFTNEVLQVIPIDSKQQHCQYCSSTFNEGDFYFINLVQFSVDEYGYPINNNYCRSCFEINVSNNKKIKYYLFKKVIQKKIEVEEFQPKFEVEESKILENPLNLVPQINIDLKAVEELNKQAADYMNYAASLVNAVQTSVNDYNINNNPMANIINSTVSQVLDKIQEAVPEANLQEVRKEIIADQPKAK